MNKFPQKEIVEQLRAQYLLGYRVELVHMDDPYTKLRPGDKGLVLCIDDIGTIHVNWDCGSTLGVVFNVDACRIIET